MKFMLFHGSFGSPTHNWFPDLKRKLEQAGQEVIAPQFPVNTWDEITSNGPDVQPTKQYLSNWLSVFEKVYKNIDKNEKLCFVGHSIGPVFILHCLDKYEIRLDSSIFVCPFYEKLNRSWQIDLVNKTFYKTDFDFNKLRENIGVTYSVFSNNDPYVDIIYSMNFSEKMRCNKIIINGGKHMNSEFGISSFPLVFDLCLSRLNVEDYKSFYN